MYDIVVVRWLPVDWIRHGTVVFVSLEYVRKMVEIDRRIEQTLVG